MNMNPCDARNRVDFSEHVVASEILFRRQNRQVVHQCHLPLKNKQSEKVQVYTIRQNSERYSQKTNRIDQE